MAVKEFIKYLETVPLKLMKPLPHGQKIMRQYLIQQIKEYEKTNDYYCALCTKPRYASQVVSVEKETVAKKETAIVMQGPLVAIDNFTVETVKIYGMLYPGTTVIVSTWQGGENAQIIEQLKNLENCEVLLNNPPEYSGMLNLNYQVVSTMAGIRKAKALGKEYVFKTRCDFRFLRLGLIDYFVNLCRSFPTENSVTYQTSRIILGSDVLGSFFRAFWVTDRFNFGRVNDMMTYWDYEIDKIDKSKEEVWAYLKRNPKTWREVTESGLCAEPRIMRNYLKRMEGFELECSVKNYWDALKRQFIMVSFEETGAFWKRDEYRSNETSWKGIYYGERDNNHRCLCYNWDFVKWLSLYTGTLEYRPEYEKFQQENIGF